MSKKDKNKKAEEPQIEDTATATAEAEVETQKKESKSPEEQLQDQLVAEKDKFMRLFAEFENYKKRNSVASLIIIDFDRRKMIIGRMTSKTKMSS